MKKPKQPRRRFRLKFRRPSNMRLIVYGVITLAIVGVLAGEWAVLQGLFSDSPVPRSITQQVPHDIFFVEKNDDFSVNTSAITYDTTKKSLVYYVKPKDSDTPFIVSQERAGAYSTDANKYQAFIDALHPQAYLKTSFGNVYITKPDQLDGDQAVIINNDGVAVLIRGNQAITADQWQKLISHFYIIRNPH